VTTTSRSRPARAARVATAVLLAGLGGCTYTVHLLSDPDGATVHLPDGSTVVTPADATFRTMRHQTVRVEAEGYRTLEVDFLRTEGSISRSFEAAFAQRGGREVTFLLVEEHGPIGSGPPASEAPPPPMR
jgi:hypothetical protein